MEFCPHCMVEHRAAGRFCNNCGKNIDWESSPGQLPMGTVLKGNGGIYHLGAVRGQGGFGITYAALNLCNAQRVAVKEYFPTRCAGRTQSNQVAPSVGQNEAFDTGKKAFLKEAMMLSAVGVLNSVVSVKDWFEANGTAYLVMEFVDGIPMHQAVKKRGKVPAGELMAMLPELLDDLEILHRYGVIHRDISPDNLVIMPNQKLKLLDFGSARNVRQKKDLTTLLKAGFSPLEQYQSHGQGAWTDVYALAATIYYCLTGIIPPQATDRATDDKLIPPNAAGAGLTYRQEQALLRALAVQAQNRYPDMGSFRQELFRMPAKKRFF